MNLFAFKNPFGTWIIFNPKDDTYWFALTEDGQFNVCFAEDF